MAKMASRLGFFVLICVLVATACTTPVNAAKEDGRKAERVFNDARIKNDQNAMLKALTDIAALGAEDAVETLLRILKDEISRQKQGKGVPADVRAKMMTSLTSFSDDASVAKIGKAALELNSLATPTLALDQVEFFRALANMRQNKSAAESLGKALADKKNPYVKLAALEAIRQSKNPEHISAVIDILREKNPDWLDKWKIVAVNVFTCLEGVLTPQSEQLPDAIEALATIAEGWAQIKKFKLDDKVRYFAGRMLVRLTGERADIMSTVFWRWWVLQKRSPSTDTRPEDKATSSAPLPPPMFDAIPVGKRFVFVIDVSDSMKMPLKITLDDIKQREKDRPRGPITPGKDEKDDPKKPDDKKPKNPLEDLDWKNLKCKLDLAKAELARAITTIPDGAMFAVVTYSTEVKMLTPDSGWVLSNSGSRKDWADKARNLSLEELTNIHGGLCRAMRVNDRGTKAENPAVDPDCLQSGADTIIFLTDGWGSWSDDSKNYTAKDRRNPNNLIGDGTHIYGEEIWPDILHQNMFRKTVINTVGIGNHDKELLKKLAGETGGTYVDWSFPE